MMKRTFGVLLLFLSLPGFAANWPERPTLRAVRVATPPAIDGDLADPAWQSAPEFTDFTQHDPDDGKPSTLPTSIRIVYDESAIYFGLRMSGPVTTQLGRRDSFTQTSDFVSINVDPQHDRLSGNAFTVNPSNVQVDTILYNDIGEDGSWDGVWDSATKITSDGWSAEVRIPYSQLRFPDKPSHTWGLNVTRRTVKNNEFVRIVNVPKGQTGFVSKFADVAGIEGIRRGRPLELVPYGVLRSDVRSDVDRLDPFVEPAEYGVQGGLDLKYALTSSLTLTGTVNPDFGQVEVDPAVVNLSQFETFFPERRPFFTEGLNIFRFGDSPASSRFNFIFPPNVFYTRRIGRSPQGGVRADYAASPSETTILGAAKLTGKVGKWSIGILDALTDTEHALFLRGSESGRHEVEPMTNYFVGRTTKEIGAASRIGIITTSVNRRLGDGLRHLRSSAQTIGVDGYTHFAKKDWIFDWQAATTRVEGSRQAIALTQRSPAHGFDRPDADHLRFDPDRTSLTGWGGRAMVAKQTGLWRPNFQVQAYSPGFETNDLGFMLRADAISAHALTVYVDDKPTERLRRKRFWFGTFGNANFGGDVFDLGAFVNASVETQKYWSYYADLFVQPSVLDDRLTRGGPLARRPANFNFSAGFESDGRKRLSVEVDGGYGADRIGGYDYGVGLEVNFRPSPSLRFELEPSFGRSFTPAQFVTHVASRAIFSGLDRRTFELGTRAEWTFNAKLSFQLFLQPFIASGDFHDPKELARPRSHEYVPFRGTVAEPDFNFRSVRGSAVARWEFRPGSALYVVWNENREDVAPVGDFRFRRDLSAIPDAPSHDVFLVKVTYWLPL